jgi:hypothetical protein
MSNTDKYIEYIDTHTDEIAKFVNERFEQYKDFIRAKLIQAIEAYIDPVPVHYEWQYEYDPYDHSGIIVKKGYISLNQSVTEFLKEYTGQQEASYESGRGWNYTTYGDDLSYDTLELATTIMFAAARQYVEAHLGVKISDEEFQTVQDDFDFDALYDNCIASDFFCSEVAVDYVGIGDMTLREIAKKNR